MAHGVGTVCGPSFTAGGITRSRWTCHVVTWLPAIPADYFTVETWNLRRLHVLFFMELGRRRILSFGVTANPNQVWVSQQIRDLSWRLEDLGMPARFLICDHDKKFPFAIEHILAAEGVRVIRTPLQTPVANCFAERLVGSVRWECLDWPIILGRRHLEPVLSEYANHYNRARPHRALRLHVPDGERSAVQAAGEVRCSPRLGGARSLLKPDTVPINASHTLEWAALRRN